jgi:hypothetical protein
MMLLPEIRRTESITSSPSFAQQSPSSSPTTSSSSSRLTLSSLATIDALHLPKNLMNPCGTSNIMVLESLPWNSRQDGRTADVGTVLVSLTSCSVMYQNESSFEEQDMYHLPIEPVPSTFVLDFDGNTHSSTMMGSGQRLAELSVEFDYGRAARIVNDLTDDRVEPIREQNGGSLEAVQAIRDMSTGLPPNAPSSCHFELDGKEDVHASQAGASTSSRDVQQQQLMPSIKDFEEQKALLQQLQLRMEQDARSLDMTLRALGCAGVFLFGFLIWAVYQFYRSNSKSDKQTKEIQESMKKTRRVLQDAVDGLHPQALDSRFEQQEKKGEQEASPSHAVSHSESSDDTEKDMSLPSLRLSNVSSSSQEQVPETVFSTRSESPLSDSRVVADAQDAPRTPKWDEREAARSNAPKERVYRNSPYTVEQFEKEWMEQVTQRRSNRKKKRPPIRPISLPSDKKRYGHRDAHGSQLVDPPRLLSVVQNGNSIGQSYDGSESSGGSGSYDSDTYSRTPNLCSTPASEDDFLAFMEDYWP